MDFDEIDTLRRHSAAWRALRADHAPLVLSFLGRVFVDDNAGAVPFATLVDRLDDVLFALNERFGEDAYPRPAKAYLDDWCAVEVGLLRKHYPPGSTEPYVDALPALEKAVGFVRSLPQRSFVGTESRLNTAFELLRQIAFGAETDRDTRLGELLRRRAGLDAEIEAVRRGHIDVMDDAAVRDRYQQFVETALGLLADLREVEDNLRALDRGLRERVTAWDGSKGELLDEALGDRDAISDSDQGRSFHAFYDFLLSRARQEEFDELLTRVSRLEVIGEIDARVRRVQHDWLDAGERTQATVRLLSEQLRRFLDDRAWLENRRVMEILRGIEAAALAVRDHAARAPGTDLDEPTVRVGLPFERPLYTPRAPLDLADDAADGASEDVDVAALFAQSQVDSARLARDVRRALQARTQVRLPDVLTGAPLTLGLAELVAYFALDDPTFDVVFDAEVREQVQWADDDGRPRVADLPRLTFVRRTSSPVGAA